MLYFMMGLVLKDEETQKSGVVFVYNGIDQSKFHFRDAKYCDFLRALPARWVSLHILQGNTPTLDPLRSLMIRFLESNTLCRYRHHTGKYYYML